MPNFNGGSDDDTYSGGNDSDTISGGGGKDTLAGGGGGDTIDGDDDDDKLYSGIISPFWQAPFFGNNPAFTPPVLDVGSEIDVVRGGGGYDTIYAGFGDFVDGGAGGADLLISLQGATAGLTIDFRALANGGSLIVGGGLITNIIGVLWIEGSEYDDTLTGSDTYGFGLFGNAPIFGRGGNDRLTAGQTSGNIYGGAGNDVIDAPYNRGYYYGDDGDDVINALGVQTQSFGGNGNDTLNAAGGAHGGAGDDVITINDIFPYLAVGYGDEGDDWLSGSDTTSTLAGGTGADIIYGNVGNDLLFSAGPSIGLNPNAPANEEIAGEADLGTEHDQLFGGDDNDRLSIGYGDDADGGAGINRLALSLRGAGSGVTINTADIITGGSYALGGGTIQRIQSIAMLWGSDFGDTITLAEQESGQTVYGEGGDDTINATSKADTIHGGAGADIINAGGGDDTIYIDAVADATAGEQINGGAGTDVIRTAFMLEVDLSGATLTGIESIITGVGAIVSTTTLSSVASLGGSFRFANGGAVSLGAISTTGPLFFSLSAAGNQIDLTNLTPSSVMQVYGQDGDDVITATANGGDYFGGGGNDILVGGNGIDNLYGDDGNDRLDGRASADQMRGGAGDDLYILENGSDRVFENSGEGNDTIESSVTISSLNSANVETLKLTGTAAINATGNTGANTLIGNDAGNTLNGGAGADTLIGGGGNDIYVVDQAGDTVTENASEGKDEIRTGLASYSIGLLENVENLTGTSSLGQSLTGNAGANLLAGAGGNDQLDGGSGNDRLIGGAGNDRLIGGGGRDLLEGGAGADTFVFTSIFDSGTFALRSDGAKFAPDQVTDFETGQDRIDLSAIDAVAGTGANDAFTFIGTSAFTGQAGQLRCDLIGGQMHIFADVDGDRVADFHILAKTPILQATDFIL